MRTRSEEVHDLDHTPFRPTLLSESGSRSACQLTLPWIALLSVITHLKHLTEKLCHRDASWLRRSLISAAKLTLVHQSSGVAQ